jgi:very-short-patch-repair endonuclease
MRTGLLAENDYRVLRFWNDEVLTNIECILERIVQGLRESGMITCA